MPANIPKSITLPSEILAIAPAPTPTSPGCHHMTPPSSSQGAHGEKTPLQPKPAIGFDPPPSRHGRNAYGLQADGVEGVDLAAIDEDTCRGRA
jgi:hypothetical protein